MSESRGRDSANISFQSSLVTLQNQPFSNRSRNGFTQLYEGLTRVLNSKIGVTGPFLPNSGKPEPRIVKFDAIWDTGASGSVITNNVVLALNLKPIDRQIVQTAGKGLSQSTPRSLRQEEVELRNLKKQRFA